MVMTADQITAELQRKKNANILPTNQANMDQYNKLTPQTQQTQPYTPTFSAYGGKDNYVAGQNDRWQQANASGDQDLMKRLQADSQRAGYTLNPYTPPAQNNNASPKASSDTLLADIRDLMNKQSASQLPQFMYDPSTDPQYQAALNRAKANSETASGNAMAELNKRGILNSTITSDRLGQIEQAEYGRVSDTILPELMNQAYARHRDSVGDQYQAGRNQINDLMNILGYTTDREDTQYNRDYQTSRDTRNDSVVDRDYNYQVGRDKVADSQWKQSFDEDKKRYGDEVAYKKARDKIADEKDKRDFDEKVRLSGIDSAISWYNAKTSRQSSNNASSNANFSKLMDIWQATGKAPEGLQSYGITAGTEYKENSAKAVQSKIDGKSSTDVYNSVYDDLKDETITKEEARLLLSQNASSLTDSDYKKLSDLINDMF